MGYSGPKKDWGGLGLEIQGCKVAKKIWKTIFKPYLPIRPVKIDFFEFLSFIR